MYTNVFNVSKCLQYLQMPSMFPYVFNVSKCLQWLQSLQSLQMPQIPPHVVEFTTDFRHSMLIDCLSQIHFPPTTRHPSKKLCLDCRHRFNFPINLSLDKHPKVGSARWFPRTQGHQPSSDASASTTKQDATTKPVLWIGLKIIERIHSKATRWNLCPAPVGGEKRMETLVFDASAVPGAHVDGWNQNVNRPLSRVK